MASIGDAKKRVGKITVNWRSDRNFSHPRWRIDLTTLKTRSMFLASPVIVRGEMVYLIYEDFLFLLSGSYRFAILTI